MKIHVRYEPSFCISLQMIVVTQLFFPQCTYFDTVFSSSMKSTSLNQYVAFLNPRLFVNHLHYHPAFSTIYKPSTKSIPVFYYYLNGVMCAPCKLTCCSLVTLPTQTQLRHSALARKKVQLGQIFCFHILVFMHQAQGGQGCDSPRRSPNTMKAYIYK